MSSSTLSSSPSKSSTSTAETNRDNDSDISSLERLMAELPSPARRSSPPRATRKTKINAELRSRGQLMEIYAPPKIRSVVHESLSAVPEESERKRVEGKRHYESHNRRDEEVIKKRRNEENNEVSARFKQKAEKAKIHYWDGNIPGNYPVRVVHRGPYDVVRKQAQALFGSLQYCTFGTLDRRVIEILKVSGATKVTMGSPSVQLIILGPNARDDVITDQRARMVRRVPVVRECWVTICYTWKQRLEFKQYNLFSKVRYFYPGHLDEEVRDMLLLGGAKRIRDDKDTSITHFIRCGYFFDFHEEAFERNEIMVKIVTPEWVRNSYESDRLLPVISTPEVRNENRPWRFDPPSNHYDRNHNAAPRTYTSLRNRPPPITVPDRVDRIEQEPSSPGISTEQRSSSGDYSSAKEAPVSPELEEEREYGVVGLENRGNTCFVNAGLQCLLNTSVVADFFRKSVSGNYVSTSELDIVAPLKGIFDVVWESKTGRPSMGSFIEALRAVYKPFQDERQHDSQEFVDVLLNELDEQLRKKFDSSVISQSFRGETISRIICSKDPSHTSSKQEPFYFVQLSFPPVTPEGENGSQSPTASYPWDANYSLNDCLGNFVSQDTLTWACPICQMNVEAAKVLEFSKLSDYVIIHLKRFTCTKEGYPRKIRNPVEFPYEDLDLREYFNENFPVGACSYSLYGIVCHTGGVTGGHYTAYVRSASTSQWYCFNDSIAFPEDPTEAVFKKAYLLFYTKTENVRNETCNDSSDDARTSTFQMETKTESPGSTDSKDTVVSDELEAEK